MTPKKKPGFNGQWVEIFSTGTHHDDQGNKHEIDLAFIDAVVSNLDLDQHEPPAVIGHPKSDLPAFGWGCALRRNGEILEAQLCDTDPQFEEMVRKGLFKKRSASFYLDAEKAPGGLVPALRHIGFLGAAPPAVKGLRDIHFEEGEATTFEFSEGAAMTTDKDKEKSIAEQIADFFREKFGAARDSQPVSFSEADQQKIVEAAVAAAKLQFSEELKTRDAQIEQLVKQVNSQGSSTTRASIVSFCESVGAERLIPALKNMGVVEFMEVLASIEDTKDTQVSVISFSEAENKDVTVQVSPLKWFQDFLRAMPPFISFGESFGALRLKGDGSQIADPKQIDSLRAGMGLEKTGATALK